LKTLARYKKIPILAAYSASERENSSGEIETMLISNSDIYIQMLEKTPSAGAGEGGVATKEIHFIVKKNRGGDKNILIRLGFQPLFQKFVELK
jgi:hypothetical protein